MCEPETFKGRKLWVNFNIKNPNPEAVEIGLGQLKHFMRVAGLQNPEVLADVRDLVGHTTVAGVKVKQSAQYGESNEVKSFDEYTRWLATPGAKAAARSDLGAPPF